MLNFLINNHFSWLSFTIILVLESSLLSSAVNAMEYQQIEKNTSYKILQTQKLKAFVFESIQADKFYSFTLQIVNNHNNYCKILLSSDQKSEIQYYQDNNRYESSAQLNGENSYLNNKEYHQIKFNPKDDSNKVQYFFVFYENFTMCNSLNYEITMTESDQYECINQCSNSGVCNIDQQCNCDNYHVDQDCNIKTLQLNMNYKVYATISAQSCEYLKFKCNTYPNLQELFLLKQTKAQFEIFYKIFYESDYNNILQSYLPNEYINDGQSLIQSEINIQTLSLEHECLTNQRVDGEVIISICNKDEESWNIQIKLLMQKVTENTESSPLSITKIVIFTLIGIFILFLLITVTYFYIKFRWQHSHIQIHLYPDNAEKLTKNTINKYMKIQLYSEVIEKQSKIEQVNQFCSICLGEFQMEDQVRQAICSHIFHVDCLEKWIYQHQNCPYCRTGLTKKDLEQYSENCQTQTQNHLLSTQNELPYENKNYLNSLEMIPRCKKYLKMKTTETLLHINFNEENYSNIPNTIAEFQNTQSPQIKSLFTLRESVQIEQQNSEESGLNQIDSLQINTSYNLQAN